MRLEPLCTMTGSGTERSYTDPLPGGERIGFVIGEGVVEGERLRGTFRRANTPHHRADGVNVDQTSGVITTPDGALVFYELRGLATRVTASGDERRIFGGVTFRTSAAAYAWLNGVFAVAEATYDGRGGAVAYHVFECRADEGAGG